MNKPIGHKGELGEGKAIPDFFLFSKSLKDWKMRGHVDQWLKTDSGTS